MIFLFRKKTEKIERKKKSVLQYLVTKIKKYVLYLFSKHIFGKHFDLDARCKQMFYVLIKDFNRFMTNKSKHHGKQHP